MYGVAFLLVGSMAASFASPVLRAQDEISVSPASADRASANKQKQVETAWRTVPVALNSYLESLAGNNSGIQFRSFKPPGDTDRWSVGGYQAEIDDSKASVGGINEEQGRGNLAKRGQVTSIDATDSGGMLKGVLALDSPSDLAAQVRDAPEWNELHIVAIGHRLTYSTNNVQMTKVVDKHESFRASGLITIELDTGTPVTIQVRRVRIGTADADVATIRQE